MCSILKTQAMLRPLAIFDANNKEHREDYLVFLRTRSLGNTKYRYISSTSASVLDTIKDEMLKYYTKLYASA